MKSTSWIACIAGMGVAGLLAFTGCKSGTETTADTTPAAAEQDAAIEAVPDAAPAKDTAVKAPEGPAAETQAGAEAGAEGADDAAEADDGPPKIRLIGVGDDGDAMRLRPPTLLNPPGRVPQLKPPGMLGGEDDEAAGE